MADAEPYVVPPSDNPYIAGLVWGSRWDLSSGPITFEIWNRPGDGDWTAVDRAAVRTAIQSWTDVADLELVERTGVRTDVNFILPDLDPGTLGAGFGPNGISGTDGFVLFDRSQFDDWFGQLGVGGYAYHVIVHEIGHVLGLAHPHDFGDGFSSVFPGVTPDEPTDTGTYGLNSGLFTVMSYNDIGQSWAPDDELGWEFNGGPMAFDIAAIQYIYGANTTTRTGADTYVLPGANGAGTYYTCIWDAAGTDTISYRGSTAVTIDLRDAPLTGRHAGGYLSRVDGVLGGFTIANGVSVERAYGGSSDDSITGNEAGNTLSGGRGADRMAGGAGNDLYFVGDEDDAVVETSGGGTYDQVRASIDYTLAANVERLRLSGSADLDGKGNASANILVGNDGDNKLSGGSGSDTLEGGEGSDSLDGGTGTDLAAYGNSAEGIRVSLLQGTISGGEADGDSLRSIEGIIGSDEDDIVSGSTGRNALFGEGGRDLVYGGSGNDTLGGGDDADRLYGGNDDDRIFGDEGADHLSGGNDSDVLSGDVDDDLIFGGNGNDRLYGGNGNDRLEGGAGDDSLWGGNDDDRLAGGDGNDRLDGDRGDERLYGGDGDDRLYGDDGQDSLYGGALDDRLDGGNGSDTLDGGTGDDLLTGGAEGDRFIVRTLNGADEIADWTSGEDQLDLSSFEFVNGAAVRAIADANSDGLVLALAGGGTLLIRDLSVPSELADADLIL